MATTYDKASLVMIPSGYKDDKLYSVKPTDGSGDFTFSRDGAGASPATRVNASGLIEKGRENLTTWSNDLNNWIKDLTSVTSGQSGYDGTNDAWRIDSTGGYVRRDVTYSGVVTFSIYAKAGTAVGIRIRLDAASDRNLYYNLSTGAEIGSHTGIDYKATSLGSGWYRIAFSADISTGVNYRIYPIDATGASTTGNIYIQDAQLEQGLISTSYIETTTAPVSAGLLGDMPRLDYSGGATCPSLLLEPSRVNVIEHSEYLGEYGVSNVSVSYNNATSPEGVQNATLVTGDAGTLTKVVNFNPASSGAYTISVFAKYNTHQWIQLGMGGVATYANFDIQNGVVGGTNGTSDIEDYGNGWYRCSVKTTTGTPLSHYIGMVDSGTAVRLATSSSTGSFWAYGMQSEIGSYPTSYIPTYGSASTRGADDVNSLTSVSDLIGQTEGTIFIETSHIDEQAGDVRIQLSAGTSTNNWIFFGVPEATGGNYKARVYINDGGVNQVNRFGSALSSGNHKYALAYKENDVVLYVDGELQASDTLATIPACDRLTINGASPSSSASQAQNKYKQVSLFKTRLTNAELAALTTI